MTDIQSAKFAKGTESVNNRRHKLLLLGEADNVLIALAPVDSGWQKDSEGNRVQVADSITFGHKVARCSIRKGERIVKYGVSIGSATRDIVEGEHVHVHNMKSDYTPTYALEETAGGMDGD